MYKKLTLLIMCVLGLKAEAATGGGRLSKNQPASPVQFRCLSSLPSFSFCRRPPLDKKEGLLGPNLLRQQALPLEKKQVAQVKV